MATVCEGGTRARLEVFRNTRVPETPHTCCALATTPRSPGKVLETLREARDPCDDTRTRARNNRFAHRARSFQARKQTIPTPSSTTMPTFASVQVSSRDLARNKFPVYNR